jgi:RHS repeat-associated protein
LHGTGSDQVLAQEDGNGVTSWHLTDHLGTVRDLVDAGGAVVNHLSYDSFGQVVSKTIGAIDSRYQFTGREFDAETGLYFYRARYYDAAVGRFISEDPIGFKSGDSNLYRYVGNSPLNGTDPSGTLIPPLPPIIRILPPIPPVFPAPVPIPVPIPAPQPSPRPQPSPPNNNQLDSPCEGDKQGGSYREVRNSNKISGAEVHHMPSWAATEQSALALGKERNGRDIAPAICMTAVDHAETASYRGRNIRYKRFQIDLIDSFRYNEAQNYDIVNIQGRFPDGRYEEGIRQMLNYTLDLQTTRPELFYLQV